MKVCIAEKPSVAREIAEVLGATQRMNGYIEGNGYQVTWTFGHLCTLKEPHEYADRAGLHGATRRARAPQLFLVRVARAGT